MITIFNRRTVYFGYDFDAFVKVKNKLDDAGIRYKTSVRTKGSRRGKRPLGRDFKDSYEYEIWVHADDYDRIK